MHCIKHTRYKGVRPPGIRCKDCRRVFTVHWWGRRTVADMADQLGLKPATVKVYASDMGLFEDIPIVVELEQEAAKRSHSKEVSREKSKVREYEQRIEELEEELNAVVALVETPQSFLIKPSKSVENEAVAIAVASDWHVGEIVRSSQVSGLNEFNKEVCEARVANFFNNLVKLVKKESMSVKLDTLVLALLGDFITGTIHEDLAETNRLLPAEEILEAHGYLSSGIRHLIGELGVDIRVICHSGNHGRMTKKQRISAERGNSLEWYMYHVLRSEFEDDERVEFLIADGYHSYVEIFGYTIRFHHGHSLKYGGGIGGLYIPTNKAIAQWDKARQADLDVFGHFHQFVDGGKFICNGSLIGYNAYALNIKAGFEPPRQCFFLVDKDDGKTIVAPIIVDHAK